MAISNDTIIDGYNLIFGCGWLPKTDSPRALEQSRRRLVKELADRIERSSRHQITIVFDAKNRPLKNVPQRLIEQGFQIVFAQDHEEADELIEEMIRAHSAPKNLTIVSSDHRLQNAAQHRKAIAIDSEVWFDQLDRSARSDQQPSNQSENQKQAFIKDLESTDWIAEFDIDPDELAEPQQPADSAESYNPFPPGYGEDLLDS